MNDRRIRRWALLGALASAALLTSACNREIPEAGTNNEGHPNAAQSNEQYPVMDSGEEQQGSEPATGGSGLQEQGDEEQIGAPGYTTPRDDTRIDPLGQQEAPQPKPEEGGDKAGEPQPNPNKFR